MSRRISQMIFALVQMPHVLAQPCETGASTPLFLIAALQDDRYDREEGLHTQFYVLFSAFLAISSRCACCSTACSFLRALKMHLRTFRLTMRLKCRI
jgi:hypothetical protein